MKLKLLTIIAVPLSFSVQAGDVPASADLLDLYAFMNPPCQTMGGSGCEAEPEELILAFTADPSATDQSQFSDLVDYHVFFENDAGVTRQIDCSVSAEQVISCTGFNGLSVEAPVGEVGTNGDMRVFAGLRDDPFFFDGEALRNFQSIGIAAFTDPGTDTRAGENVLAVVMGIKNRSFPSGSGTVDASGDPNNLQKVWVSSTMSEFSINGGITGSWFNPDQTGQGYILEVVSSPSGEDQFVVYFFGYDDAGDRLWLLGSGPGIDGGTASVDVIRAQGVGFGGNFDPDSFAFETVGTMAFTFSNCDSGTVSFTPANGDLVAFTTDIERLTNIASLDCSMVVDKQVDRVGRPLAGNLIPDSMRAAYDSASDPDAWRAMFLDVMVTSITMTDFADGVLGNVFFGSPEALAEVLVDDRLQVDLEWWACPGFFGIEASNGVPQPHTNDCGGRKLEEDAFDIAINLIVSGFDPFIQDFVDSNDREFLSTFPFLAMPH